MKKTIFYPESLRAEFQAAVYQDSSFEFLFIFLILLGMVFLNFNDVTFARENIFSNKSHQNLHRNLMYSLTLISIFSTAAVFLQVSCLMLQDRDLLILLHCSQSSLWVLDGSRTQGKVYFCS